MSWGTFPQAWVVVERGLVGFTAGENTGKHVAALKCYLALAAYADWESKEVRFSLSDLEIVTGCSRPMVVAGTKCLAEHALVEINKDGVINNYRLLGFPEAGGFSKVPLELMLKQLRNLPNRGESALSALKVLMLLLAFRSNVSATASLGHIKMRNYGGMRTSQIRAGIDHLVNHRMIHVNADHAESDAGRPANLYTILADFNRGARPTERPSETSQSTSRRTLERRTSILTAATFEPPLSD
jgi:hypothetical protein